MSFFTIAVKEVDTCATIHTIGSASTAHALERTEKGVNINLNHTDFYTEIVEVTDE